MDGPTGKEGFYTFSFIVNTIISIYTHFSDVKKMVHIVMTYIFSIGFFQEQLFTFDSNLISNICLN